MWSPAQQVRLGIEKGILEKHFLGNRVIWTNPTSIDGYVDVKLTSNSNKPYTVRIYLNEDFPNSCPELVLVSPEKLNLKNGDPMPDLSRAFHTIGERHGLLKICHFEPKHWTQDNTFYQVFMKARLWIEAYEGHRSTGKDMDVYLAHQKRLGN